METRDRIDEGRSASDQTTVVLPAAETVTHATPRLDFAAQTHTGRVRSTNEDQYLIAKARKSLDILATTIRDEQPADLFETEGHVLLVADGLGGHDGGEHASAVVVKEAMRYIMQTAKWFFRLDDPDEAVRVRLLREALNRVDQQLAEEAEQDPRLRGMGTTLTAVTIIGAHAFVVHVGDSRAYLLRGGNLQQLTTDHTLVREMVARGIINPGDAKTHHLRHVVTNVIGANPGVEGQMFSFRLLDGDRLLVCTDGLTEPVPDSQIGELLTRCPDSQEACHALVQAALDKGGPDNITVIVATWTVD